MTKIKTEQLRPGMKFTKPAYIDEDMIFLQPDLPLKQAEIDRLVKWNVEEIQTEGEVIKPVADGTGSGGGSYGLVITDQKNVQLYRKSVEKITAVFNNVAGGGKVTHDSIDSIVKDLMGAVDDNQNTMIQMLLVGGDTVSNLADNSIKGALLATIIGKGMKMLSFRLLQLATGALLHDIGMLKIPEEIRAKKGKLTPEELQQVRSHPVHGYTIVLKELQYTEEVAAIALLHQERWDGTGYPRQLKSDGIPLGARIVAVSDAFVAMVNKSNYRDQMIGYKAMKSILSDNGRHFDPKVLKALLMSVGIYPVGSLVLLNNSSIGRVVETHSMAPLRPKIQLMIDEAGDKISDEVVVDLLNQKDLFIAKAIDPQAIERLVGE